MPSTQRDPIVDEERLLTGRPIVRQVAERYLEVLANRPPPEGLWKRTKFYVKKAIGAVFDGIRVTLETFGVIEETTAVERLAKDLEKKFEGHPCGRLDGDGDQLHLERAGSRPGSGQGLDRDLHGRAHPGARPQSLYAFYEAQTADSAAQIQELQGADPQAPQRDRRIQHRGPPAGPVRADQRAARRAFQLDPPDRLLRQRPGIHPPATQGAAQGRSSRCGRSR